MNPGRLLLRVPHDVAFAVCALALVLLLGCVFHSGGTFFKLATHAQALWQVAAFGILACGMTIVILSAGIDLSVGSVAALAGVVFAILVIRYEQGLWIALPLSALVGAACGAASGVCVAHLRLQPFIATLAMMAFARGLAKQVSSGRKIFEMPAPEAFEALNGTAPLIGLEWRVVIFLACAAATWALLRRRRFGRYIYAIGDNEEAARLSGAPVRATKVLAYALCGLMAGLAGVVIAAQERQGNPDAGVAYELTAIAMVVVGGTSLMGGRGGITLTVLGVLTIGYLRKILDINGVPTAPQLMITGGIIVAAVLVQGLRPR
ncbi:MAG: ABC transporter permease [Phycisphaerales bacterium JB039]